MNKRTICLLLSLIAPIQSQAGWFDFLKSEPEVTEKDLEVIRNGICGCSVGAHGIFARTASQAQYEMAIKPLMNELELSLRDSYKIKGSITCKGWGSQTLIGKGRNVCISTYSNYGKDRALKTKAESMK